MHALTRLSKPRLAPKRKPVQELDVVLKPRPKVSDPEWMRQHKNLMGETVDILKAKRRFVE